MQIPSPSPASFQLLSYWLSISRPHQTFLQFFMYIPVSSRLKASAYAPLIAQKNLLSRRVSPQLSVSAEDPFPLQSIPGLPAHLLYAHMSTRTALTCITIAPLHFNKSHFPYWTASLPKARTPFCSPLIQFSIQYST